MGMDEQARTTANELPRAGTPRTKRTRRLVIAAIVVVVLAVMMPVSNLLIRPDRPDPAAGKMRDPMFAAIGAVLVDHCSDCHSTKTDYPWYFAMPVAKTVMLKDVEAGIDAFDMTAALFSDEADFTQVDLARLEYVMVAGTMPPMRYVAMHWDARPTAGRREGMDRWVRDVRARQWASPNSPAR